jgi:hypothetical protein
MRAESVVVVGGGEYSQLRWPMMGVAVGLVVRVDA